MRVRLDPPEATIVSLERDDRLGARAALAVDAEEGMQVRPGALGCVAHLVLTRPAGCYVARSSRRAASRMTSSGAFRPVHSSKLSAPCATRTSSPSTVPAPCLRAAASNGVDPW